MFAMVLNVECRHPPPPEVCRVTTSALSLCYFSLWEFVVGCFWYFEGTVFPFYRTDMHSTQEKPFVSVQYGGMQPTDTVAQPSGLSC